MTKEQFLGKLKTLLKAPCPDKGKKMPLESAFEYTRKMTSQRTNKFVKRKTSEFESELVNVFKDLRTQHTKLICHENFNESKPYLYLTKELSQIKSPCIIEKHPSKDTVTKQLNF